MRFRKSRMGIRTSPFSISTVVMIYFCFFVGACGASLIYLERSMRPSYEMVAESLSRRAAADSINATLIQDISQDTKGEDLFKVLVDRDGRVAAAQLNSPQVARLQALVTSHVQEALNQAPSQVLTMRLGKVLNNTLLSEWGPSVSIRLVPIGTASSSVEAEYHQAGMNQTLNILYLTVTAHVRIIAPFLSQEEEVTTRVPMAYILLVGQVPVNFYNANGTPFNPLIQGPAEYSNSNSDSLSSSVSNSVFNSK